MSRAAYRLELILLLGLIFSCFSTSLVFGQAVTGIRDLPDGYVPASILSVSLDIEVEEAAAPNGVILNELIPIGWNICNTSPPYSSFEPTTGEVSWIFLAASVNDTDMDVSYELEVPANATGTQVFSGSVNYLTAGIPVSNELTGDVTIVEIGASELAVLGVNASTSKVVIQLKDSSSGLAVNNVWFSHLYEPLDLRVVPDISSNGAFELAVLSENTGTDKVIVQVKDSLTGLLVRNVWFSDTYTPLALDVLPDVNSNGASELAVLSENWSTDKVIVQVKDSLTGLLIKNVWFSDMYEPLALQVVPDINSNDAPELAVLSMNSITAKVVVQIKDSSTGLMVKNVWFSDTYTPLALDVLPDLNSNGSPELAVLSKNLITGKVVVQVKDSFTGLLIKNVWFSDTYEPLALQLVPDINYNGFSELAVLSKNLINGKVVVQVKDSFAGLLIKNVWFSDAYEPLALQLVPDN